jgi:hypothetical protein
VRQAAVDGQSIDAWHLAAVLEALWLRMDHALRIMDRASIFAAAEHALTLHRWLVAPDFGQEVDVRHAEKHLAGFAGASGTPLLAAATGMHTWLDMRRGASADPRRAAALLDAPPCPRYADAPHGAALRAEISWAHDAGLSRFCACSRPRLRTGGNC